MDYNIIINIKLFKLHKYYIIIYYIKVFGVLPISLVLLYTYIINYIRNNFIKNKNEQNDNFITNT